MKDVSNMTHYLGMEVNFEDNGIHLNQREFIHDFITSFGMETAHPHTTPLDSGFKVDDQPDPDIITREYQCDTGKLQWLATKTRPDLAYTACLLAQHNAAPTRKCWNGLMHTIKYLKGSIDQGLFYPGPHRDDQSTVRVVSHLPVGYSDSDWGGPSTGRKSVSGFIFLYGKAPISWISRKQTCVATSSNEAEYMAASEATKEAIWLRRICAEMGIINAIDGPPINLNMDNQGAMALTSTEGTKRSKHIDVRFHHVRDSQQQGLIAINAVRSNDNPADGMTKVLRTNLFDCFLHLVSMRKKNDDNG